MKELKIRFSEKSDKKYLIEWLSDPEILKWFPMCNKLEIEDAANIWIDYAKKKAVLTALWNNEPCGIANLYLQTFKKLSHQSLFAIIIDKKYRNRGIGKALMDELIKLAKKRFKLEVIHLEVYEGNPAIHLYERLGFTEYGVHKRFLKENGKYLDKILMQKCL